jgi:hypothetical protein
MLLGGPLPPFDEMRFWLISAVFDARPRRVSVRFTNRFYRRGIDGRSGVRYNCRMAQKHPEVQQTTRIWLSTIRKLRLIAALTDETVVGLLDRLAAAELARVKKTHEGELKP